MWYYYFVSVSVMLVLVFRGVNGNLLLLHGHCDVVFHCMNAVSFFNAFY